MTSFGLAYIVYAVLITGAAFLILSRRPSRLGRNLARADLTDAMSRAGASGDEGRPS